MQNVRRNASHRTLRIAPVLALFVCALVAMGCRAVLGASLAELDAADIAIGEIKLAPVGRALIMGKNKGIIRVYVDKTDARLLGATLVAVKGENLAHLLAWSIQQGLTVYDILRLPFYHPVMEEALQACFYDVLKQLELKSSAKILELEELNNE